MKYFGTDGIRGITLYTLTDEIIENFAKAVCLYIKKNALADKIIIAKDTRNSSDYIIMKLAAVFLRFGIDVFCVGIAPTPCLAFLTARHAFGVGIMISASHNPSEYNGIKLFNLNGRKFTEKEEELFEEYINLFEHVSVDIEKQSDKIFENSLTNKEPAITENFFNTNDAKVTKFFGKYINAHCYVTEYIEYAKKLLKNLKTPIIIDCANGAASEIALKIFEGHEKAEFIFNDINMPINENCGCTHPKTLIEKCTAQNRIGIAFDGDADRVMFVTGNGKIIDGDIILFLIANSVKNIKKVVGTLMTNYGLEQSLKKLGIELVRVNVGDKYISEYMFNNGLKLGGEQAGHTIISELNSTGDGILTSIVILNLLAENTFEDLLKNYFEYPQKIKNIKIDKHIKQQIKDSDRLKNFVSDIEEEMKGDGRVVIRPSGTEDILRIMIEGDERLNLDKYMEKIESYIKNEFNI